MAATTVANWSSVLKTLYSTDAIDDLVLPESPFLGQVKKDETFDGYNFRELVSYGDVLGTGNIFASAQSNAAGSSQAKFDLTRVKCYGFAQITGELIEASRRKDKASFMSALQREMDSAASALGKKISHQIFRNSYGALGVITSAVDGSGLATLTFTGDNNPTVNMIEVGDSLVFAATDGGNLLNSGAVAVVTHVTRGENSSTVVVDHTVVATDGVTTGGGDYVYKEADYATATKTLSISGLSAWLPASAPTTGDSFFGTDRSVDTRLGGLRYDASAKTIVEGLTRAVNFANSQGAKIDAVFLPYKDYADLVDLLGTRAVIAEASAYKAPQIGFKGVQIMSNKGPVNIFADLYCPGGVAFGLTMSTWTLRSLGKAPHILDLDSQNLLRLAAEDSYEIRWGSYHQLGCSAPGWNIRITL